MDLLLSSAQTEFADSLRNYLDELDVTDVMAERKIGTAEVSEAGPKAQALLRKMSKDGWLGVGWPKEFGGLGRSLVEQWIFVEEMTTRGLPTGGLTLTSVGPTIMRLGAEGQLRQYLPQILAGEYVFAIGYSEPNAGTDLGSLSTRATLEDDMWVINGQKVWTTGAHYATHIWLAVRTGRKEDRTRGISIIVVPMDTPGILVRPLYTQSDGRTNEVFFDDVRVPASNLIGELNGGWDVIRMALNFERLMPYSSLWRDLRRVLQYIASEDEDEIGALEDVEVGRRLAVLAAETEIARLLCLRVAAQIDEGLVPGAESSMAKVFYTELQQRLHTTAIDVLGERALLRVGGRHSPVGGVFERLFRSSTILKFGAGTNEVQRDIIATQHLGLSRAPTRIEGTTR
jgi:hypothetical protein